MSNHSDERVIATRQRWAAAGWAMLSLALSLDLVVRTLILRQDPRQWLDIGAIWMAALLYASTGMTASGVEPYEGKYWKRTWPLIPLVVVVNTLMSRRFGTAPTLTSVVVSAVAATAGLFVAIVILRGIYGLWERRTLGRGPREE
jgi:hypothetical protein